MEGLCRNQSIERLGVGSCDIDFSILSPYIINSSNLRSLQFWSLDMLESASSLAMALTQRQYKSLTNFSFCQNNLDDESLTEITTALTGYPYLETFLGKRLDRSNWMRVTGSNY